jgi:hypothetical protein
MGNPSPTDRRFDKPSLESLVDLINRSNKTYIKYGEIEADQITPIEGSESVLWNTTARIRLAGAEVDAPYTTMTYGRLDISEYLPEPEDFTYEGLADAVTLFEQLHAKHHIQLNEDDCALVIGGLEVDGSRVITFSPNPDHPVWTGQLSVIVPASVPLP